MLVRSRTKAWSPTIVPAPMRAAAKTIAWAQIAAPSPITSGSSPIGAEPEVGASLGRLPRIAPSWTTTPSPMTTLSCTTTLAPKVTSRPTCADGLRVRLTASMLMAGDPTRCSGRAEGSLRFVKTRARSSPRGHTLAHRRAHRGTLRCASGPAGAVRYGARLCAASRRADPRGRPRGDRRPDAVAAQRPDLRPVVVDHLGPRDRPPGSRDHRRAVVEAAAGRLHHRLLGLRLGGARPVARRRPGRRDRRRPADLPPVAAA